MTLETTLASAIELHQAGRLAQAAAAYEQVLALREDHPVANHNLGVLLAQSGRLRRALPFFERAAKASPGSVECLRSLANCHYAMGRWEEALSSIEQAGRAGPADPYLGQLRAAMAGAPGGRKVFCVGRNKTGTTSMEAALHSLGFRMGLQARGEMLRGDWAQRDFSRILALCRTADAFQDVPFSLKNTFEAVDGGFPGSRFILTVRDTPEQWFDSLVRFHTRIVNKGRIPTADDLREFAYRYKGDLWDGFVQRYGDDERLLYDRDLYIASYLDHNRSATEYFRHRPRDLLVINVGQPDAMQALCEFLQVPYRGQRMPHMNRSD
jgi:tetratricopeptide (TPR) repeat protein